MSAAPHTATDRTRAAKDTGASIEPTYSASFSDPLGDRLLCYTTPGAAALEYLRFKPELADAPGFEAALRASVEALGCLDPSLATVRRVERADDIGGLALVSEHEGGQRLSELLPRAHGVPYAVELIRAIGPALALLHRAGHAHGALTPERIIVSRTGRPIVREHVLGSALASLGLSPDRLRTTTGVAVPRAGDGALPIQPRLDVIQLGLISLSLLVGRRVNALDYPGRIVPRLDDFARTDPAAASALRPWLERALQLSDRSFADGAEALAEFPELPANLLAPRTDRPAEPQAAPPAPPPASPYPVTVTASVSPRDTTTYLRWAAGAAAVVVVVVGLVLPAIRGEADPSVVEAADRGATPATPAPAGDDPVGQEGAAPVENGGAPDTTSGPQVLPAPTLAATPEPVSAAALTGTLRVSAPFELQVFESGEPIGSNGRALSLTPGAHQVDLVNEEFGFRATQTVEIVAGRIVRLPIEVPDGRLNINAVPWADVWIDGKDAGQTPLANVALPVGRHEVVFRHPQFGERRETVVVRADGPSRVNVVFQQENER